LRAKGADFNAAGSVGGSTMTIDHHPFLEKQRLTLFIAAIFVLLIFALTFVY
jgi:preprotein translocase subunit SecG